jgi:hypothetical protein
LRCLAFDFRNDQVSGYGYLSDITGSGVGQQSQAAENDLFPITGYLRSNWLAKFV